MLAFAYGAAWFTGPFAEALLTGLKVVAVAIVAQAVTGMAKALTPDRQRASIAVAAAAAALLAGSVGQIAVILLGGVVVWKRLMSAELRENSTVIVTVALNGAQLSRTVDHP